MLTVVPVLKEVVHGAITQDNPIGVLVTTPEPAPLN